MLEKYGEQFARSPFIQGAVIFGVAFLIASAQKLGNMAGLIESDAIGAWIIFTSFILFFSIATSLMSLKAENMNKYWGRSIITFMAILILSGLIATLYSGLSIDEAGSFRWLFFVMTFGFLVFLSIVRLMKRIVDIAIKQDDKLRGE